MLSPHAVRAAEVFVEQADDRAERVHHQPRPTRPDEFARPSGTGCRGKEQQPRRADAVGAQDRDVGGLKVLAPVAVDVDRAGTRPRPLIAAGARGAGDELHAERDVLRPVRAIDRPLGPFDAAPHAGRPLRARAGALCRAAWQWHWRGPPVPAELVVRLGHARPIGPSGPAAAADPCPAETPDRPPGPRRRSLPRPARSRAAGLRRSAANRRPRRRACGRESPTACSAANGPRRARAAADGVVISDGECPSRRR